MGLADYKVFILDLLPQTRSGFGQVEPYLDLLNRKARHSLGQAGAKNFYFYVPPAFSSSMVVSFVSLCRLA
jgi:hypothetical protein